MRLPNTPRQFSQSLTDPAFSANPWPLYSRLHQSQGPWFWLEYGLWCLSEFAAVNRVMREKCWSRVSPLDADSPPWPPNMQDFAEVESWSLLSLEPPEHTRLRKRINGAFVNRRVHALEPRIRSIAERLLDEIDPSGQVELLDAYLAPLPVAVIAELLGVPPGHDTQLLDWSHRMVRAYTGTASEVELASANQAAAEFRAFLSNFIDDRRRQPRDDLLSLLSHPAGNDDALKDGEIISMAVLLLNAGHEATVHQSGNALWALTQLLPRDDCLTAVTTDAAAENTVNEAMRFMSPLHQFTRYAMQDIDIGRGVIIKRGEKVALLLAAANRDPQRFNHADQFNPFRDDTTHLALGAGIHFCAGAQLARSEIRIALQTLFTRFPDLELHGDAVQWQNNYHFFGARSLPVTLSPRNVGRDASKQ